MVIDGPSGLRMLVTSLRIGSPNTGTPL